MSAAIHHSIFLKADTRVPESKTGCNIYTAIAAGSIAIRDVFVAGGASIDLSFTEQGEVLLIPVVGAAIIGGDTGFTLAPGQLYSGGSSTEINAQNPLADEKINLLHITLTGQMSAARPSVAAINITTKNTLISAVGSSHTIHMGAYDSRVDTTIQVAPDKKILVYIINGSFEVDGRLMEYRDALVLWDRTEIDFEALSEAAIILFIEF